MLWYLRHRISGHFLVFDLNFNSSALCISSWLHTSINRLVMATTRNRCSAHVYLGKYSRFFCFHAVVSFIFCFERVEVCKTGREFQILFDVIRRTVRAYHAFFLFFKCSLCVLPMLAMKLEVGLITRPDVVICNCCDSRPLVHLHLSHGTN